MSPTIHDPDLDAGRRPMVSVPRGWRERVGPIAIFANALLLGITQGIAFDRSSGRAAGGWLMIASLVMIAALLAAGVIWSRMPAFAVFKDGIKLDNRRRAPGRSSRDPWSYGFYSWDEVGRCHWSPFHPGQLSIYLKAAEHEPPALLADPDGRTPKAPPMMVSQGIPGPYREAVEAALRAAGKWDD